MGTRFQLRDYQSEAVDFLTARTRGFIVAPAGSGKTVIGVNAVARKARSGQKVTWIANTIEQVSQAGEAFSRVEGPEIDLNIVCAASNPDVSDSDIVVFDEAHHVPAVTWLATANAATKVLIGLSATPWSEDEERNVILKIVFQEFFVIERERVLKSGHLVEGKVYIHDIDTPGEFDLSINEKTAVEVKIRMKRFWQIPKFEHERRVKWQFTQEAVQENAKRNTLTVDLANGTDKSVLLLVHSITHGDALVARIPGSSVVHSKLGKKKRTALIEGFRSGAQRVLCSTSLADEGLDVPRASVLILAAGGRAAGKLEQRAGRILRPFEGKSVGIVHDFLDRGATFALAQAKARMRVYEALGYEPEIVGTNSVPFHGKN